MKKLLLVFSLFIFFSCSDNALGEDCGCEKISYKRDFPTASSNNIRVKELSRENVPCQEQENSVTTSSDSSGSTVYYYKICCDNIDNSIASICD